jgi:hypothetical protein
MHAKENIKHRNQLFPRFILYKVRIAYQPAGIPPCFAIVPTETHTKRQATQHDCLPSLMNDGDKRIEIVDGEGKHILYWADYSSHEAGQKPLVSARQAQRTCQGRTTLICLQFSSVSTVCRVHNPLQ